MPTTVTTWLTPDMIPSRWPDAPTGDELEDLIITAQQQCEIFAPALPDGAPVPARYRMAQLMQARAINTAKQTGAGDTLGPEGQTVRVYPMDWQVKALLRPTTAVPAIG